MSRYVYICDQCRTVVDLGLSNRNAEQRLWCVGQEPGSHASAAGLEPVKGNHDPHVMRLIGTTPL